MGRLVFVLAIVMLVSGWSSNVRSRTQAAAADFCVVRIPTWAGELSLNYSPDCVVLLEEFLDCLLYLEGIYPEPLGSCCGGMKIISQWWRYRRGRQGICECFNEFSADFGPIDSHRLKVLPEKCGVMNLQLPPISSENNDCSKY
ncbi:PREDICTED: non-specific lipid-transfer protein 2-like [Nelumbo nucifera]|uniref:Non-specific lipid-transfer protein 2-like n=2 Tax=Nelumbo nucifera TaxID=4432 RepID=A0A1U8B8D2_NELNU|nr:PREDICTED: non-specific lipid-transfer protein 2-like [Nelumbo nucifera]DAD32654.1 TPA_asm: hypothetical protein HUJ06_011505 [Nelumbo nucifera]